MFSPIAVFFYTIIFLVSCATPKEDFVSEGLERASFELSCDADKLQIKSVGKTDIFGRAITGSQVGVSGCEKKSVYLLTDEGWVRNSEVLEDKKQ